MARIYKISPDTFLLTQWDAIVKDAQSVPDRPFVEDAAPDISGNWYRAKRAMECRNPREEPGLQSDQHPAGSRSEVIPPDIDRAKSQLAGHEIARPLPWDIVRADNKRIYHGSGAGSVHDHGSAILYKGVVNGRHQYNYMTTRTAERTYKWRSTRAVMHVVNNMFNRKHVIAKMVGTIIVDQDRQGNVTQLTSVVLYNSGNDPDLPQRFREISVWERAPKPSL